MTTAHPATIEHPAAAQPHCPRCHGRGYYEDRTTVMRYLAACSCRTLPPPPQPEDTPRCPRCHGRGFFEDRTTVMRHLAVCGCHRRLTATGR